MFARSLPTRRAVPGTGFWRRIAARLALQSSRARLSHLDGHALRDIGLTRDEAEGEALRPFWDAPEGWRR